MGEAHEEGMGTSVSKLSDLRLRARRLDLEITIFSPDAYMQKARISIRSFRIGFRPLAYFDTLTDLEKYIARTEVCTQQLSS